MDQDQESIKATRKEWIGLLVLSLPCMIYSMDLTVLNLAIPQLSLALKPSASELLWIVDIYGFFVAGSLITMGTLGDRIGRRKMLLIGATVFAIASAIAAFSKTSEMLIATRALQGIAGATLAPSTLSLIRVLFRDPKQRTQAIGLWGTSFSVGGIIGPMIGGALIEHFWWGSVFLINIPVMMLLLLIGPRLLPEYKDEKAGAIDIPSAALSLFGILLIVFGLKKIAENGFSYLPLVGIFLGAGLGLLFVLRQKKLRSPLIDLKLFSIFTFNALLTTNASTMFAIFGTFIFNAQYMQLILGFSPLEAGLWSLPSSAGMIMSSAFSPLIAHRTKPAYLMTLGLCLAALGFGLMSFVQAASDISHDLRLVVIGTTLMGIGCSPVLMFTTNMLVNSAPPEKAGSAAALSETANELGGALGIALLGSVGTFIYREKMSAALPAGIPEELRAAASSTLENALEAAKTASVDVQGLLSQAAQKAYISEFSLIMVISASILAALAVLVLITLRGVRLETEHADSGNAEPSGL